MSNNIYPNRLPLYCTLITAFFIMAALGLGFGIGVGYGSSLVKNKTSNVNQAQAGDTGITAFSGAIKSITNDVVTIVSGIDTFQFSLNNETKIYSTNSENLFVLVDNGTVSLDTITKDQLRVDSRVFVKTNTGVTANTDALYSLEQLVLLID